MTYTVTVDDAQFGVATGSNVVTNGGNSWFDGPPSDTTGLVIMANPDDPSPSVFSVGDTYDLSYKNPTPGNGGTLEDAVVIRSDAVDGGGHAVVFQGTNENGELEQIVWSPGLDLQGWYEDAEDDGGRTGFHTRDQDASTQYEESFVCFSSQTRLTTPRGEVAAADLHQGDLVHTLDRGFQPILWIGRRRLRVDRQKPGAQPVLIQPGAMPSGGLRHPVIVSPQHRLLLAGPTGAQSLAPAKAFVGLKGIRHMRGRQEVEYISLLFAHHEVLDVSGLAAESFLPGPQGFRLLSARQIEEVNDILGGRDPMPPARPCLGGASGRRALKAGARPVLFDAVAGALHTVAQ